MTKLPSTFTSLYRLFLRTVSTSVLHHRLATHNLRQLWRPVFNDAAQVIRELEEVENVEERQELANWLQSWEKRMDGTLAILYNAATSRGIPHQLARNLSFIVLGEHQRLASQARQLPLWNARLPPDSREYQVRSSKVGSKEEKRQRLKDFDDSAWRALGEVVRMAEGRDNLSLGRIMIEGKIRDRT
ncbi:hypothetical protein V5O48_001877 [Marasmius crinis-equi]|uniref:Uncharacterized protein n=1 Tax=Marasmius crinis-equi TaxID=585013 RepID=A0ABR3FXB7_9AGAR